MAPVIILISANTEWKAVRSIFPLANYRTSPFGEWFYSTVDQEQSTIVPNYTGQDPLFNSDVIFFQGGCGKIAAAGSVQYVIDRWNPKLLINFGTCGGFDGLVERGEIILANKTIVYDIIEQMGDFDEHIAYYSTTLDLSWLKGPYPIQVNKNLLVSADRDLMAGEISELHSRYGAIAGDWESGAIAWVAAKNGVRVLILRGVSDLVSASGGEAYGNLSIFSERALTIIQTLVNSLPGWLEIS